MALGSTLTLIGACGRPGPATRSRVGWRWVVAGEDEPYLVVVPAGVSWGWEMELRRPTAPPLVGGARYLSEETALEAGDFVTEVVNHYYPVRFEEWAWGWEHQAPPPGDSRVVVRPVPWVGGWLLAATHPGGDIAAYSPSYPTLRAAADAQGFLQQVSAALGDPQERRRTQVRSAAACACTRRGRTCLHHDPGAAPPQNPVTVGVRPRRGAPTGWELVVRGPDRSPLRLSDPHPSKDDAEAARDFALAVANAPRPVRFEGWTPRQTDNPGYVPPSPQRRRHHRPGPPTAPQEPRPMAPTGHPGRRLRPTHVASVPDPPRRIPVPRLPRMGERAHRGPHTNRLGTPLHPHPPT